MLIIDSLSNKLRRRSPQKAPMQANPSGNNGTPFAKGGVKVSLVVNWVIVQPAHGRTKRKMLREPWAGRTFVSDEESR